MDRRTKLKLRSLERNQSAPSFVSGKKVAHDKQDSLLAASKMGHDLRKRTFYKLTSCQHCSEVLWGLKGQGYQCTVCNLICHEKCMSLLMVNCSHYISEEIVDPVPHTWVGPTTSKKKKKWCNVCRQRVRHPYFCQVCRMYSHERCKSKAFNNCKSCATYTSVSDIKQPHHWVEGNLPFSSKCEVCTKSCATDTTLSGFRCSWCGIAVHTACLETYQMSPNHGTCSFRDMEFMMLPPKAVSFHVSVDIGENDETVGEDGLRSMFTSPVGDEDEEEDDDKEKLMGSTAEPKGSYRPVLVIDGSGGQQTSMKWRKRTLHPTHVTKQMTAEELLLISLRKCEISDPPDRFYLAEIINVMDGTERELKPDEYPYSTHHSHHGLLKLYIRLKQEKVDLSKMNVRVLNSMLTSKQSFVNVEVDSSTTVSELVKEALSKFELTEEDPTDYVLFEVNQVGGVMERELSDEERPWTKIQELLKDSIVSVNRLRYYLRKREKLISSLYVWGLAPEALESKVSAIQHIKHVVNQGDPGAGSDPDMDLINVDHLLPKLGGVVVNVPGVYLSTRVYSALVKACPSKPKVKALPTIHEDKLDRGQEPLLVFVNGRSGGNQGIGLLHGFSRHLNPHQVYDLAAGGPLPGIYAFRKVRRLRVAVVGGDGTVGWVLGVLDDMRESLAEPFPPCAVVPVGTGNDLARALKWGGGYSGEKIMHLLRCIEEADSVPFDRWNVMLRPEKMAFTGVDEGAASSPTTPLSPSTPVSPSERTITMNNYLGFGLDAEIALDFHEARELRPEKFSSRFHNKGVYFQLGIQKTFSRDIQSLEGLLKIQVDGKPLKVPTNIKGLVLLNIQSWGAGSEPWGSSSEGGFQKNSFNDGLLEVMGLSGAMHIGQIKSGMKNGIRLAQGKEFRVEITSTIPVQADGEAWMQPPSTIIISPMPHQACMLEKSRTSIVRSISHKEAREILARHGTTATDLSSLGSRHKAPTLLTDDAASPLSEDPHVLTTHTVYHKSRSSPDSELDADSTATESRPAQ